MHKPMHRWRWIGSICRRHKPWPPLLSLTVTTFECRLFLLLPLFRITLGWQWLLTHPKQVDHNGVPTKESYQYGE